MWVINFKAASKVEEIGQIKATPAFLVVLSSETFVNTAAILQYVRSAKFTSEEKDFVYKAIFESSLLMEKRVSPSLLVVQA